MTASTRSVDESNHGLSIRQGDETLGDTGRWVETLYRDNPGDGSVKLRVWVGDFWDKGIPSALIHDIHDAIYDVVANYDVLEQDGASE